jgi:hypothetical protein
LFFLFYSELLLAAHQLRWKYYSPDEGRELRHRSFHIPVIRPLMRGAHRVVDSTIDPRRSGLVREISNSPSFRMPVAPAPMRAVTAAAAVKSIRPNTGGPSQPEMKSFQSVNANKMVDLFSGDFSYNVPLMDVGGYPVNLSYHSGRSMDEDASWVGLGWNINPGSITREMRGLPDDFSGGDDTIKKVSNIKPNITIGANVSVGAELVGLPLAPPGNPDLTLGLGFFHSTYNGWGMESTVNASLSAGGKSTGVFTGGLNLDNNSQSGVTISPTLSYQYTAEDKKDNGSTSAGLQITAPYNSRTGLKDIEMTFTMDAVSKASATSRAVETPLTPAGISFAWPTYTPTISMPLTNKNYTFTAKVGGELFTFHPNAYLSGYYTVESVAPTDTAILLPAYGYLNFQNRGGSWIRTTSPSLP